MAARTQLLPVPASFERADLERAGFLGWRTWGELRATDLAEVPEGAAAYVVYRPSAAEPAFLDTNVGGRFKDRDPTAPSDVLQSNWVPGAHTVYIGKADGARRRLKHYARFGAGRAHGSLGRALHLATR